MEVKINICCRDPGSLQSGADKVGRGLCFTGATHLSPPLLSPPLTSSPLHSSPLCCTPLLSSSLPVFSLLLSSFLFSLPLFLSPLPSLTLSPSLSLSDPKN